MKIAVVTGSVEELLIRDLKSKQVNSTNPTPVVKTGTDPSIYVLGNPEEVCNSVNVGGDFWFEYANVCCDTIPYRGICLLPKYMQFFKLTSVQSRD